MNAIRCISLISGLDSILSTYLIKKQGLEIVGINFLSPFILEKSKIKGLESFLGIKIKRVFIGEEMLDVLKNPHYGYGKRINPCIDCRILMLKKGKEEMLKENAKFVVTGEVIGQRPMSQRKEIIKLIEKESGLESLVVRPLCAKLLPPTLPEKEGWVKRDSFLGIKGRGRKTQIKMADEIGLKDYPSPSGGCLLTDTEFSKRVSDIMKYEPSFGLREIELLKVGRHFRLTPSCKSVVGRNEEENKKILSLSKNDYILQEKDGKGAVVLLTGDCKENLYDGASLSAYFSQKRQREKVLISWKKGSKKGEISIKPEKKGKMI